MEQAQIHGHEVLNMMINSGKTYTRASLVADIHQAFGETARFCTCSASNMTADDLVTFLQARGKFLPSEDGFHTSPDVMCKH